MIPDASDAPVRAERIDVLDVLRGVAILGIFYMNIPFMGASIGALLGDIRLIGWTPSDQLVWVLIDVLLEGTQRGMLEFLFGASMMILARNAMSPDGPVDVADRYYRRNLWLAVFGLLNIFVFLWPGDILLVYAIAALPLFLFRRMRVNWLLTIGLAPALAMLAIGSVTYVERSVLVMQVDAIEAQRATGAQPSTTQRATLDRWRAAQAEIAPSVKDRKRAEAERIARTRGADAVTFIRYTWSDWAEYFSKFGAITIAEAFFAMLLGIALFKMRIIQGGRSAGFYLRLMLACYVFGLTARAVGTADTLTFSAGPRSDYATYEIARLATSLGHVALINWLVKQGWGTRLLAPLRAAGRTAFSLYFMQQVVGIVLFAPFALGLWGRFGWAELAAIATLVIAVQLVIANIWMRYFVTGPFEWLWRSLSAVERQPFRRRVDKHG